MHQQLDAVRQLVAAITPHDDLEREHQADVLAWLAATSDICRRAKPATPPKHLVAYAVLVDAQAASVFLVDHVLAGLWLPAGGHVEPDEHPLDTVRRETREELGIEASFMTAGERPVFVTVTPTVGRGLRHVDVSLWYVIDGDRRHALTLDRREFTGGRWWTLRDVEAADPERFDPYLVRFIAKLRPLLGRDASTSTSSGSAADG